MKVQVLGVKTVQGVTDGNAWDMSVVLIQTKIEDFMNQKVTVKGYGFEITEMPLDSSCLDQFKQIQFPALLMLEISQRPKRGKFESCVCGVANSQPAFKAA